MFLHGLQGREQIGLVAHVPGEPWRGRIRVLAVADRLEEGVEPDGDRITGSGRTRAGYRIDDAHAAGSTKYGCENDDDGE